MAEHFEKIHIDGHDVLVTETYYESGARIVVGECVCGASAMRSSLSGVELEIGRIHLVQKNNGTFLQEVAQRTRIKLAVYVDLDPVPGTFHSADSARNIISSTLAQTIPHYNPIVSIESYDTSREN